MDALLAFAAALIALRLAGRLLRRWRARRAPELAAWSAALVAYAVACGALAWGAAAGWDGRVFRVYYLFGGLLAAPLLGAGSLLLLRVRGAVPAVYLYTGLAVGVAIAMHVTHAVRGDDIPAAQDHLAFFPARLVAVLGNTAGTIAVVGVAVRTLRRRPLGNVLIVTGIVVAGVASALTALGAGGTAALFAVAVVLLYTGFVAPRSLRLSRRLLTPQRGTRLIR